MESLFNDAEKRFILAEMIKISQLDVGILVNFIKSHGIRPDWLHMQLPGGRTLSQCLHAAESMLDVAMQPPPMVSPLKRKSLGDLDDYYVAKRQAVESPGESSQQGPPFSPNVQPYSQPANFHHRPNGSSPAPPVPSISVAPYNPSSTGRKRGRPPKSAQNTWQSYAPIAPSPPITAVPRPHSPGVHAHPAHQGSVPGPSEQRLKKKALPEIAPRPTQGMPTLDPAMRSPAAPGVEYQNWREETSRRDHYQVHSAEVAARERSFAPGYPPILPRPQTPHPHLPPVGSACPAPTEPRRYGEPPPMAASELTRNDGQTSAGGPINT